MSADSRPEIDDPPSKLTEQDLSNTDQEPKAAKVPRPKGKTKAKTESHSRFNPEQQTVT